MTERIDGDRVIVSGVSQGAHFPRTREHMMYRWSADGRGPEGPFQISGPVFGRSLQFLGPGAVGGPVCGAGDVHLQNHTDGMQRFLGGISATGSVKVASRGGDLQETLVGDLQSADVVLRGEVIADQVWLENTIVFGNVHARRITVIGCVVFGALVADEVLSVVASSVLHYHAPSVRFGGPCMMLNAMGESTKRPMLGHWRDGAGTVHHGEICLYPACRDSDEAPLTRRPWEIDDPERGRLYLEHDWVTVPAQVGDDGAEQSLVVLSIGGRALDFRSLRESLGAIRLMLRTGLEYEHYNPATRAEVQRWWRDGKLTRDERLLMRLITEPVESAT